jgi:hypothetical protein
MERPGMRRRGKPRTPLHAQRDRGSANGDYAHRIDAITGILRSSASVWAALTLKYLGERGHDLDPRIKAAAAFSVPAICAPALQLSGHEPELHGSVVTTLDKSVRCEGCAWKVNAGYGDEDLQRFR